MEELIRSQGRPLPPVGEYSLPMQALPFPRLTAEERARMFDPVASAVSYMKARYGTPDARKAWDGAFVSPRRYPPVRRSRLEHLRFWVLFAVTQGAEVVRRWWAAR